MAFKDIGPRVDAITIDPAALSPASGYEIVSVNGQKILRLKKFCDFSFFSRTIAAADSEFGWTWDNRGEVASANEDTTTANAARWTAATSTSDWFSGPYSAARRYKTFSFGTVSTLKPKVLIARVSNNASTNYTGSGIQITEAGTDSNFLRYQIGYGAAAEKIISYLGTAAQEVATTGALLTSGIWLRMTFLNGTVLLDYCTTNTATPPLTGWVRDRSVSYTLDISKTYEVGMIQIVNASSSGLVTDFLYYDDSGLKEEDGESLNPAWGAQGYDTGVTAVQLIANFDLLSEDATISDTAIRNALSAVGNLLNGDTATLTYSCVLSNSTGASAGMYYAPGSVVGGTGRYMNLWVKMDSDGTEPGSINLDAFNARFTIS